MSPNFLSGGQANFSQKLHENEEFRAEREAGSCVALMIIFQYMGYYWVIQKLFLRNTITIVALKFSKIPKIQRLQKMFQYEKYQSLKVQAAAGDTSEGGGQSAQPMSPVGDWKVSARQTHP